MKSMLKGANLPVTTEPVRVVVAWRCGPGIPDVDVFAALLDDKGKTRASSDFVYFDRAADKSGSVRHTTKQYAGPTSASDAVGVDLAQVAPVVQRIVIGASTDGGAFASVKDLRFYLYSGPRLLAQFDIRGTGSESALIGAELYRRSGGWKFRAIGQGYATGLAGLAGDFGIYLDTETARAARAARNRARSRLGQLETAARMRAEAQLGELTTPTSAGRLHLGAIKWSIDAGGTCDWTTDQLIDDLSKEVVGAAFPLLDQGGMPVDLYARIELAPTSPHVDQTPEQRVRSVSFGSRPVMASAEVEAYQAALGESDVVIARPAEMDAALAQVRPAGDRSGWRWLTRLIGDDGSRDAEPAATTPESGETDEQPHPMDPTRAVLRTVVLPAAAAAQVEAVTALLLHNLPLMDVLALSERDRHTLTQTASRYLPECLTTYRDALLVIPKGQVLPSGRTLDGELLHALIQLRQLVEAALSDIQRGATNDMLAFSAFIEDKRRG